MTILLRSVLPYKAAILALVLYVLPSQAQDVRIRLFDKQAPTSITLSAYEGAVRLHAGDYTDPLMEIATGQTVLISPYDPSNELRVSSDALTLYTQSLRAEPVGGASFGIEMRDDEAEQAPRRYTGNLLIAPDQNDEGLKLINAVPLEAYVASVVSTEYSLGDLEGSKAMAVLARTYVLNAPGKYGPDYDLVDDTRSQVYRGEDAIIPLALEAARSTEGEVLTYRGRPIQAVYHSSSGGHTADNESVWAGAPVPYLRANPTRTGNNRPMPNGFPALHARNCFLNWVKNSAGKSLDSCWTSVIRMAGSPRYPCSCKTGSGVPSPEMSSASSSSGILGRGRCVACGSTQSGKATNTSLPGRGTDTA